MQSPKMSGVETSRAGRRVVPPVIGTNGSRTTNASRVKSVCGLV